MGTNEEAIRRAREQHLARVDDAEKVDALAASLRDARVEDEHSLSLLHVELLTPASVGVRHVEVLGDGAQHSTAAAIGVVAGFAAGVDLAVEVGKIAALSDQLGGEDRPHAGLLEVLNSTS